MVTLNVSDEGKKIVTLTPQTSKGKATRIDTKDRQPSVTVNEEGSATAEIEVTEDGKLKVTVTHGTVAEGADFETSSITVEADADMDAGEERSISETIVVTTTRAEASSFGAEVSEEIPA